MSLFGGRIRDFLAKTSHAANRERDAQNRENFQADLRTVHGGLVRDLDQSVAHRRLGEEIRYEAGRVKDLLLRDVVPHRLSDVGYRVYSQFDEDGIVQYLLRHVPVENDLFVEFGVEDYHESNTRYLLQRDGWRGVILDGGGAAVPFIEGEGLRFWHDLTFVETFITKENIDALLAPYAGDIGLLSVDIDGMDYWVWEAIESVSARIVIVEYQVNFGPDRKVTVPYRPDFDRTEHHYSNLCYGASLAALTELGRRKGYSLVGTSGGPNAFFVRDDVRGSLRAWTPREAYRDLRYRESRDRGGGWTHVTGLENKQRAMADGIVLDLEDGREKTVAEAFGL